MGFTSEHQSSTCLCRVNATLDIGWWLFRLPSTGQQRSVIKAGGPGHGWRVTLQLLEPEISVQQIFGMCRMAVKERKIY